MIRPAVPPPPPPNTAGIVGADVTPAAGKTNYTSTPSQQPINTVCSRDVIGAPETGWQERRQAASFTVIMRRVLIGDAANDYSAVDCEWLERWVHQCFRLVWCFIFFFRERATLELTQTQRREWSSVTICSKWAFLGKQSSFFILFYHFYEINKYGIVLNIYFFQTYITQIIQQGAATDVKWYSK